MAIYLGSEQVGGGSDISTIIEAIYPVGSIYMSVNNANPSTLFGGTWEQIEDKFLLSAGSTYSAGATGGAATVSLAEGNLPSHTHTYTKPPTSTEGHVLNVAQLPVHYHAMRNTASAGSYTGGWQWNSSATKCGFSNASESGAAMQGAGSGTAHSHTITNTSASTGATGSGTAHNNMPPYLAVYVWKRIA